MARYAVKTEDRNLDFRLRFCCFEYTLFQKVIFHIFYTMKS